MGPRSDFSKPCQGAAEKSANATRTGASRQIPSRFPTARNVYQERCRQTIRSGDFFVVDGTGRGPGQAKAGYHHEGDILPFDILNKAWYTRLSSTNRNLSKRQIHNLISHFYVPVPKGRKHLIQVLRIFRVQKDYTQLVAEFPHNPCE